MLTTWDTAPHGSDDDREGITGETSLHTATEEWILGDVRTLLVRGADVNARDAVQ
jgi:hypothetical protein